MHPPTHLSVYPRMYTFAHALLHAHIGSCGLPTQLPTCSSMHTSAHASIHPRIPPRTHPPISSSTHASAHVLLHSRTHARLHPRVPLPTRASMHPCFHSHICSPAYLFICLLTHSFILSSGDSFIHSLLCDTFKFSVRSEDWVYFLLRSFNTSEVNTAVFHPTQ